MERCLRVDGGGGAGWGGGRQPTGSRKLFADWVNTFIDPQKKNAENQWNQRKKIRQRINTDILAHKQSQKQRCNSGRIQFEATFLRLVGRSALKFFESFLGSLWLSCCVFFLCQRILAHFCQPVPNVFETLFHRKNTYLCVCEGLTKVWRVPGRLWSENVARKVWSPFYMATLMQENLKNVDRKMKNKHRGLCRLAKNGNWSQLQQWLDKLFVFATLIVTISFCNQGMTCSWANCLFLQHLLGRLASAIRGWQIIPMGCICVCFASSPMSKSPNMSNSFTVLCIVPSLDIWHRDWIQCNIFSARGLVGDRHH